jgi:hypothetical protein
MSYQYADWIREDPSFYWDRISSVDCIDTPTVRNQFDEHVNGDGEFVHLFCDLVSISEMNQLQN